MSTNVLFPPSLVVSVSVLPTPQNLQTPNINTAALISSDTPVWASVQDYAVYSDPASVAADFGSSSNAFKIATAFFAQQPNVLNAGGYLVIIPRKTGVPGVLVEQDITYTAVATGTGGNSITIAYTAGGTAGQEVVTVVGNAISVQIATGVSTAAQVLAAVRASSAAMALVTAYLTGTASNPQTTAGATNLATGSASGTEPVLNAILRTQSEIYYFGVLVDTEYHSAAATLEALAAYIQTQPKMLFYASSDKTDFAAAGLLDLLRTAGNTQTVTLYYHDGTGIDTPAFAAGFAGRALSTDYDGSQTVGTMNLKQIAGFNPDQTLTRTDLVSVQAAGVSVYINIGGFVGLFTSGTNAWFDQIYGQFWLQFALQAAGFDYLAQTAYKVPQTNVGIEGLKNAYREVCAQGVINGFLAPGKWNSSSFFGNTADLVRNISDFGYYVYAQSVDQQSPTARAARQAPLVQIAVKLAGAVHSSTVIVNVNQ